MSGVSAARIEQDSWVTGRLSTVHPPNEERSLGAPEAASAGATLGAPEHPRSRGRWDIHVRAGPDLAPSWASSVLLLAALLLASSGPGLAATAGRPLAHGLAGGIADQAQADPIADEAFELGYDLDSIFRFVADEIAYEPYPGILRGALGTLQARAGNSADKALLLAALLDASLIPYRFAQGSLDEAASAQLLDTLPVGVEAARRLARGPLDAGEEQIASSDAVAAPRPSGPLDRPVREAGRHAEG